MYKKIVCILMTLVIFFSFSGFGKSNKEDVTEVITPEQQVEQSEFLYPAKNNEFRYDKYTYYVEITQCLSLKANIVIPDTIDSLPVYKIKDEAFKDQTTIKTVSISNNVFSIGESAFENCPNLESVKLPNKLTNIGDSAFEQCVNLKSIEIPNTLAFIPSGFCKDCESLSYVVIDEPDLISTDYETGEETYTPDRIIDDGAFDDCVNLRYVWIPEDCSFGDDGNSEPFDGSTDNLNIYSYSQSDAAKYASQVFCDFTLIQSKSQLTEFKSLAATASKTKQIVLGEAFNGEEIDVIVENAYVLKTDTFYSVSYEDNNEIVTKNFSYSPKNDTCVTIFGLKIKNNTSKPIKLNTLDCEIYVDSYVNRFIDLGTLNVGTISRYAAPSYTEIPAGETSFIYLAAIMDSDWTEAELSIGGFNELNNTAFVIKAEDKQVTYIGSSEAAIEETKPEESTTNPVETSEEETTSVENTTEAVSEGTESTTGE